MTILFYTPEADANLNSLEKEKGLAKRLRAVRKALGYLELNTRHRRHPEQGRRDQYPDSRASGQGP